MTEPVNAFQVALEDAGGPERVRLGDFAVRHEGLAYAVIEVGAGADGWPYHWEGALEEWLLVLSGHPTVRTPEGEETLRPGDLVCFPRGPDGAHAFRNATDEPVRVVMWSNTAEVNVIHYPDDDRVGYGTPWGEGSTRPGDDVPYWSP